MDEQDGFLVGSSIAALHLANVIDIVLSCISCSSMFEVFIPRESLVFEFRVSKVDE